MTKLTIPDVMNWSLEQLYNYVISIEDDLDTEELALVKQVKHGELHLPVHIKFLTKEYYTEYPNSKKATVHGLGKLDIEDLWEDLELREKALRKIIFNHLEEEDVTEGRL